MGTTSNGDRLHLAGDGDPLAPDPPADLVMALRSPSAAATLDQLSAYRDVALQIFEARTTILETARKRAIRITYPSDWNLYRDQVGTVIGYLHDAGCERVRDILGIEVFNVGKPEKIPSTDGVSYTYVQTASGRSKFTQQVVEDMEGGRSSDEDFCKDKRGAVQELLVRKACRANLDGNIARELMGMKSVPLDELKAAWDGTGKDWNQCRKARGFGTQDERHGATSASVADVTPPTCTVCKGPDGQPLPLKYRQGSNGRAAFYGCPNYQTHPTVRVLVDAPEWIAKQKKVRDDIEEGKRFDREIAAREGQS